MCGLDLLDARTMHLLMQVYSELFTDATPERLEALFKYLDKDNAGVVDFLLWSRGLRLQDVPQVAPRPATLAHHARFEPAWPVLRACHHVHGWQLKVCLGYKQIIKACRAPGPLAMSALSDEELALLEAMMERLGRCAKAAFEVCSRLFFIARKHSIANPRLAPASVCINLAVRAVLCRAVPRIYYPCLLRGAPLTSRVFEF